MIINKTHIPIEEAKSDVLQELKEYLNNLKQNPELQNSANKIYSMVNELKSSGTKGMRLTWFEKQFKYIGQEKQDEYIFLKRFRKKGKNSQAYRTLLNNLQLEIYNFISIFMNRPLTTYVLYYKDEGKIYRYDASQLGDKTVEKIYSKNTNRAIQLDKATKNIIQNEKTNILVDEHFNNYFEATQLALKRAHWTTIRKKQKNYNMGHIAEAFERHWQQVLHSVPTDTAYSVDWGTDEQLIQNFLDSKGNVAWWRSGDVGSKQVKWLDSNSIVSAGSLNSIQELANYIIWLSKHEFQDQDIPELANSIYQAFVDPRALDNYGEETIDRLLDKIVKSF